jgi:hypothetical protein
MGSQVLLRKCLVKVITVTVRVTSGSSEGTPALTYLPLLSMWPPKVLYMEQFYSKIKLKNLWEAQHLISSTNTCCNCRLLR